MRKSTYYCSLIFAVIICAAIIAAAVIGSGILGSLSDSDENIDYSVQTDTDTEKTELQESVFEGLYSSYDSAEFLANVPTWDGFAFTYVNNNKPDFANEEIWTTTQESLDPLDYLGRCGTANSCIGKDGMPTEPRGDISSVEPTGWHTDTYEFIEGSLLFNRCHLIGHQLSGDDAIPRNLITGTSYLNRDGMLQFENAIAAYVKGTGNHVMYRVTPIFSGNELVARGVHMEAISVEDDGAELAFNVFCYNVQPGVDINYSTGENKLSENTSILEDYQAGKFSMIANTQGLVPAQDESLNNPEKHEQDSGTTESEARLYVLNTNTGRFHYPNCKSVIDMADHNKQEEETTREDLIRRGYKPCGNCKP